NLAVFDGETKIMTPRDVICQQNRPVGIAELDRVRKRQQRLRQELVRRVEERFGQACGAFEVLVLDGPCQILDGLPESGLRTIVFLFRWSAVADAARNWRQPRQDRLQVLDR